MFRLLTVSAISSMLIIFSFPKVAYAECVIQTGREAANIVAAHNNTHFASYVDLRARTAGEEC
jgi:hypothetical protein